MKDSILDAACGISKVTCTSCGGIEAAGALLCVTKNKLKFFRIGTEPKWRLIDP